MNQEQYLTFLPDSVIVAAGQTPQPEAPAEKEVEQPKPEAEQPAEQPEQTPEAEQPAEQTEQTPEPESGEDTK